MSMAVKVVWVLMAMWSVHHQPELVTPAQFSTPDECKAAAIKAVEVSGAQSAFCVEGYADPLQYLPYTR